MPRTLPEHTSEYKRLCRQHKEILAHSEHERTRASGAASRQRDRTTREPSSVAALFDNSATGGRQRDRTTIEQSSVTALFDNKRNRHPAARPSDERDERDGPPSTPAKNDQQ